jgi:hypothetical protein
VFENKNDERSSDWRRSENTSTTGFRSRNNGADYSNLVVGGLHLMLIMAIVWYVLGLPLSYWYHRKLYNKVLGGGEANGTFTVTNYSPTRAEENFRQIV